MKKSSFLTPLAFFLIGFLTAGILASLLSIQSTNMMKKGDASQDVGDYQQAIEHYVLAQKLWPILYGDSHLEQKIQQARNAQEQSENLPALVIFLKNDAAQNDIQTLKQEISQMKGVRTTSYTSKEEAFAKYVEQNSNNPECPVPDILDNTLR